MARKPMNRRLQVIHPDCAGIDVGKSKVYVAVDPERSDPAVRSFRTFTDDLEALLRWLKECGVRIVAMEATGVYWKPVWHITCCATAWNSTISGPITLHTMTSSKWRSDSSGDCATLVSTSK